MQHNGILTVGKAACAVVLSCLLATSPLLDGTVATRAFAADPGIDTPNQGSVEGAPAPDATKPAPDDSKYTNEVVPLVPSAPADNAQSDATPAPDQPAPSDPGANAGAPATGDTPSSTTPTPAIDRVTTDVELSTPEGDVPAKAGTVIVDGVKYTVNPDGGTAKVTGWYGTVAPKGDVVLAEKVVSGADEYRVTSIADKAFENCDEIESLTLPDSLEAVGEDAFKGCARLQRIDAGERNETFSTHDGMLFSKDLTTLLICPEGKQGVAQLPESTTAFEPTAFAACTNLTAFQVPETNTTFAAIDGILYTSDRTRLLLAPANTVAVTLAPETTTIAAGAFAECANLNTIVSNAAIQQIEPGAFALNTITNAVVALSASENYDALKAVWDDAGFSTYTEPATPGEIQQPEPQQSGFAFQLLDDYTLAVSWVGEADPEANLVIPTTAQLNGIEYKVSTIAAGGFQGRDSLSSVQIRAPITTIGDDAFAGCAGLASIELAEGITSIGAGAFSGTAVENATIPASVSFIGAAAFANCANLSRILTFSNAVDVAGDAIAGCTGVFIYAPYEESGAYPWNPGLVVSGNHILPYGVSFSAEPLSVEVGETADLFEGGICEVPEGCELSYAYAATPISVEAGQVTGKKAGTSEVNAVLSMDGVELDRSVRVVEVVAPRALYSNRAASQQYDVVFKYNNGEADKTVKCLIGDKVECPIDPTKDGYTFAGWYKDEECTQIWRFATDTVADNTMLYAKWVVFDITYEYPANSGQYVYYDILSSGDGDTPGTVRTASGTGFAFSPNVDIEGDVVIPATITQNGQSYTVVEVGDNSFGNVANSKANKNITSITLPDTVEVIGDNALRFMDSLSSCILPSSVKTIRSGAFYGNKSLTSIELPGSVREIAAAAFSCCPNLSTINVSEDSIFFASVDGVLYSKDMKELLCYPVGKQEATYTIPSSVIEVQPYAMTGALFSTLDIPSSVESIGVGALYQCKNLQALDLPDRFALNDWVAMDCTALSSVVLGSSVSSLPGSAFSGCKNLKSITAYGDVTSIEGEPTHGSGSAFYGVDKNRITVNLPSGIIGGKDFATRKAVWVDAGFADANVVELTDTTKVIISFDTQGGSYIAPQTAEGGLTASKPETPTLEGKVFAGWYSDPACTNGNEWDFATWVTETTTIYAKWVDVWTFYANAPSGQQLKFQPLSAPVGTTPGTACVIQSEKLVSGALEIPELVEYPANSGAMYQVTEIGANAFADCTDLTSVTIPEGVRAIGQKAFARCAGLEGVSLPASLEVINGNPFGDIHRFVDGEYVSSFSSITVAEGNTSFCTDAAGVLYEQDAAGNKVRLIKAPGAAPNGLIDYAIPNTVKSIDGSAIQSVPWLKSLSIPALVDSIDTWAFSWLINLERYDVAVSNGKFYTDDNGILYSKDKTTLIAVPAKVTFAGGRFEVPSEVKTINSVAFERNEGLVELVVPDSVTSVGSAAMSFCPNLTSVILGTGFRYFSSRLFMGDANLQTIIAKGDVKDIPGNIFLNGSPDSVDVYMPDNVGGADFATRAALWANSGVTHVGRLVEDDAATGLTYTMQNDFSLSVRATNAGAPAADLVLPAARTLSGGVNTYPVTVVEQNAFKGSSQLKELTLPATITTLGASAFEGSGLAGGKLHVFGDLSAEGINEGAEVTGSGSFKGLDKSKIVVDFASGVSEESKVLWKDRKFAISAQTFVAATFDTRGGSFVAPQRLAANTKIAEPTTPTKGDMMFVGWYADPELTTAWNFNTTISADTTLYAKWKYGEGQLPTMLNGTDGADASWEITEDGTLTIKCDKPGAQIKPLWGKPAGGTNDFPRVDHWSPMRDKVKRVVMEPGITLASEGDTPANMDYWFAGMTKLSDINNIYLPKGVERVTHLFGQCESLTTLPEGFSFPESLVDMNGMFYKSALSTLPSDFRLPSKLISANSVFNSTNIVSLPAGFTLPSTVTDVAWMFSTCKSLKSLPEGFTFSSVTGTLRCTAAFQECSSLKVLPDGFALPANVSDVRYMFTKCTSLETLPEGFLIPNTVGFVMDSGQSVSGMTSAFETCTSLTKLPKSFDFPADIAAKAWHPFYCDASTPIKYEGENESVLTFDWGKQNRTLVLPVDVTFDLRYGNINGKEDPVIVKVLPGDRVAEPSFVPVKDGYTFTGWFKDGTYTQKWDFNNDTVSSATLLYAGWALAVEDTFYSEVDGKELRFQILTKDGASGTGTVRVVRNDHGDYTQISGDLAIPETVEYEGNTYTIVEVGSEKDTGTSSVFQNCTKLTSVSIPATVKVLGGNVFCDCPNITSITFAEGSQLETISMGALARTAIVSIVFPDTVKTIGTSAFLSCSKLTSVTLNEGLEIIGHTAFQLTSIESIDIPRTVREIDTEAFEACLALKTVSIPSSVQTIRELAFNLCPSLTTIQAESAIAFLDPTAFADTTKQTARVLLPMQPSGGITFEQLVTTWNLTYGFMNVVGAFGALPTVSNPNPTAADFETAGWSLSFDGVLEIHCKEGESIADLGWAYDQPECREQYWGSYRDLVTSVDTRELAGAQSMNVWFAWMNNLKDISNVKLPGDVQSLVNTFLGSGVAEIPADFVIPNSATDLRSMFNGCASITVIPDTFKLPENAREIGYLFGKNPNLTDLPANFKIPDSVTEMAGFFNGWTSMTKVPESFAFPENCQVTNVAGMFQSCTSLTSLPDNFELPASVENTYVMFWGCTSLASLPENFKVPSTVTKFGNMFQGCTSLTSLPDNFDIPASSRTDYSLFYVDNGTLPMYYGGANENVINYVWEQAHRTLVTPDNRPFGTFAVTLNTKNEGEVGPGQTWTTMYTNTSGMLAEPAAPSRPGMVFALWYYDEDCTQRVDFSKPFEADTTLYGKFVAGTRSGTLPTVAGTGSAWWSLSDAGTLYVGGPGKIESLGWPDPPKCDFVTDYWALYRADILSVSMAPSVDIADMRYWFYGCTNLTDISEVVIPEGVNVIGALFWKCSSLRDVPEGFRLPDSVTEAYSLFRETGIVSLPASFILSENLYHAANMFAGCKNLESLPDGFSIRSKKTPVMLKMLYDCPSLKTLPSSFVIPEGTDLGPTPFYVELAEGESRVPTYYNGSDSGVLNYDWESQNRTLITDAGDRGMFTVTYKTMDESGVWTTRTTSLTDSKGIATNPGAPLNGEYVFTGWCTDEACLDEFDFSTPLAQDQVLYGKWIQHGGRGTQEGKLPTVDNVGSAWWWLTLDGELGIECDKDAVIADLNWVDKKGAIDNAPTQGAWSPYRGSVTSVVMRPGVSAVSTGAWFMGMDKLSDISRAYIPAKTEYANCMFSHCSSLSDVSSCLTFPAETTAARSIFAFCENLTSLPEGFTLSGTNLVDLHSFFDYSGLTSIPSGFAFPTYAENLRHMFSGTKLVQLPADFALPTGAPLAIDWLFGRCFELESLPAGFFIPDNVEFAQQVFFSASKLKALPEGFTVPAVDVRGFFVGCTALTYIPSSLRINDFTESIGFADFLRVPTESHPDPVTTYYAGNASDAPEASYWLNTWNRMVVTADNPADTKLVDFMLPGDNGEYPAEPWTSLPVSADGMLESVSAPEYANKTFAGWFIDAECTTAFDFTKTVAEQIASEPYVLYAKYQENSGKLPTTDEQYNASWELTDDGTLKIHCEPGAVISDFGWVQDVESGEHWRALRDKVLRIQMDETVRATSMAFWFTGMQSLVDASGVFIPEGVNCVDRLFARCPNLTILSENLTIPGTVKTAWEMLSHCTSITALPTQFKVMDGVESVSYIFDDMPGLTTLPVGFTLPDSITNVSGFLHACPNFKSLPAGFNIPPNATDISSMFYECRALEVLPDGFRIPDQCLNARATFYCCNSLKYLPDGFTLPSSLTEISHMFKQCNELTVLPASINLTTLSEEAKKGIKTVFVCSDPETNKELPYKVTTYYAGDPSHILDQDYWTSQYRTLVTSSDVLPDGMHAVSFQTKFAGETGWTDYAGLLSDSEGKVPNPGFPAKFGYAFSGWYTDQNCQTKFNFDTDKVAQDTTLYGTFSLVIDVDVPVKMNFVLDSSIQAQPQAAQMRSFTPVPLGIMSITTAENPVADEVFPDATTRAQVGITFTPNDGTPLDLALTDTIAVDGLVVNSAKNASSPGIFDYTIGLRVPSDTLVKRYEHNRSTSIASITYEVAPKQ